MMDTKQVKKIADKEVNKHEKKMHKGMAPTKLKKGGPTGMQMRAVGRNMARANNQRGK
jgi:hypothetical protein